MWWTHESKSSEDAKASTLSQSSIFVNYKASYYDYVDYKQDSVGRYVYVVGLPPLGSWDRGFDSRWGHARSSVVYDVCCVGIIFCDELGTRSESYRMYVTYNLRRRLA